MTTEQTAEGKAGNGNGQGAAAAATLDEKRLRAEHNQALARIQTDHDERMAELAAQQERDLAELTAKHLAGMPFAARMYFDPLLFRRVNEMAERMAASASMPKHVQKDPIMALYCIERAWSWGMSPLAVAMGTFKIGDAIGHYGRIIIAAINGSPRMQSPLTFEHIEEVEGRTWAKVTANFAEKESRTKKDEHGNPVKYLVPAYTRADEEGLAVIVSGHIKGEAEPRSLKFALKQAWPRNSTLWATDPRTQICYTAARRFGSIYVPEIVAGARMEDDFGPDDLAMKDITPVKPVDLSGARPLDPEDLPHRPQQETIVVRAPVRPVTVEGEAQETVAPAQATRTRARRKQAANGEPKAAPPAETPKAQPVTTAFGEPVGTWDAAAAAARAALDRDTIDEPTFAEINRLIGELERQKHEDAPQLRAQLNEFLDGGADGDIDADPDGDDGTDRQDADQEQEADRPAAYRVYNSIGDSMGEFPPGEYLNRLAALVHAAQGNKGMLGALWNRNHRVLDDFLAWNADDAALIRRATELQAQLRPQAPATPRTSADQMG